MFYCHRFFSLCSLTLVVAEIRRTPGDMNAAFVIINNGRIGKGAIQFFRQVDSLDQCVIKCVENLSCVSFNYHAETSACELLSGKFNKGDIAWVAQNWKHYDTPQIGNDLSSF